MKLWTLASILIIICDACVTSRYLADDANPVVADEVRIGIAWRTDTVSEFYTNVVRAIKEAGGTPVLLEQVNPKGYQLVGSELASFYTDAEGVLRQTYADEIKALPADHSNAAEVVGTVCAVIFTGGEDISPTLLRAPEPWHGIEAEKDYNATRDVSDYLMLAYCLEQNLPVMGICRGMQMLSVVSGATIIQDIPTYYANLGINYECLHRNVELPGQYRDYSAHDVQVSTHESLIYQLVGSDVIRGVPSWHHQCVGNVSGTPLVITGQTDTQGTGIIEVVERRDKTFCIGLQFHPEAAIVKHLDGADNAAQFMSYDAALRYFTALVQQARIIDKHRKKH